MSLVSHLTAGATKWSPTSTKVQYTKSFICGLLKEKLNLMIDCASSQGGTSTTGNVVRRCLVRKDDSERDFLYWILTVLPSNCKQVITDIHTYLGAILRVYNSNRRIHTDELSLVCRELYQLILTQFSWANITPTMHKLLAHAASIISDYNDGYGLEQLSEEGLESSNKLLRRFRERLSRKFSFEENLKDVFLRIICQSDPILLLNRKMRKSTSSNSNTLSKQDLIVNSLIIEDD